VIREKLETALILEDDVDWDVNIHAMFEDLSRQLRMSMFRSTGPKDSAQESGPYGKSLPRTFATHAKHMPKALTGTYSMLVPVTIFLVTHALSISPIQIRTR
jgi:hypothetical protein